MIPLKWVTVAVLSDSLLVLAAMANQLQPALPSLLGARELDFQFSYHFGCHLEKCSCVSDHNVDVSCRCSLRAAAGSVCIHSVHSQMRWRSFGVKRHLKYVLHGTKTYNNVGLFHVWSHSS